MENPGADTTVDNYLASMSIERQELSLYVSGTTVYLDVQAIDGGDITYYIDGVRRVLNCTTGDGVGGKARIEVPQGTASAVQRSIIYVAYSEQDGEAQLYNTVATPTGAYTPVAIMGIKTHADITDVDDALIAQRTTESTEHNNKGAISWMREKMRAMGALYFSGVDPHVDITTNAGSEDNVGFQVTNGEVFQLHRQNFPNYDITANGIWVANASGAGTLTHFQKLTDLNSVHEILDGTALNDGDSIVLTVWGAINYSEGGCKLFVNLPKDKYTTDADAIVDKNNTAVTRIPYAFRTVGFPIAQLVLKYNTADNGTWSNLLTSSETVWHSEAADESSPNYPSNYGNNASDTITLIKAGASSVRVHFDDFKTEANYDFVTIRNASDPFPANITEARADPLSYHGNLGQFTSAEISGTTIKVKFWSDGSVTRKGYHIDALEYSTTVAAGAEIIDIR